MITNERQYKITKRQLAKLKQAIYEFDPQQTAKRVGSEILALAEREALKSEAEILANQLMEYERLKSGNEFKFEASSLTELPQILVQARIAQQLSQRELAVLLSLKEQQIQRYEAEEYKTASLRRLQEIAEALKLNISGIAEINPISKESESLHQAEFDLSKFPIKEMYKRRWFEGFSGSFEEALQDGDELVQNFLSSVYKKPAVALHHKYVRAGSQLDKYALLAWECRVLSISMKAPIFGKYQEKSLDSEWISKLVKLSRLSDGPLRAKEMLQDVGIALIIEPPLSKTYLDGAALLCGDSPVIGMTLRYDRLDNFWFVLLHELVHVIKHLRKGKFESIFDDLDTKNYEKFELEAEKLAGEALIPSEEWDSSLARFIRSEELVKEFSDKLEINPAIVAGRIRHEADNYIILNDLVGQGEVRNKFPDVIFGV